MLRPSMHSDGAIRSGFPRRIVFWLFCLSIQALLRSTDLGQALASRKPSSGAPLSDEFCGKVGTIWLILNRYDKAALQGHAQAQNNLGVLHQASMHKPEYPPSRFLASLGAPSSAEPRTLPGPRLSSVCDEPSRFVGPRATSSNRDNLSSLPRYVDSAYSTGSTTILAEHDPAAQIPIERLAPRTVEAQSTLELMAGKQAIQEAVEHSILANQLHHEQRRTDALMIEARSFVAQNGKICDNDNENERTKRIAEANRELLRWRNKVLDCETYSQELWRSIQDTEVMFERAKEELQTQGTFPKCKTYHTACQPDMSYRKAGMAWTIDAPNRRQFKMPNPMDYDSSQVKQIDAAAIYGAHAFVSPIR